ncbi:MAG: sulfite exporter TauE/SafE family protein [bacterium]
MITILLIVLGIITTLYFLYFAWDWHKHRNLIEGKRLPALGSIGFGTNFFDTLGIGSFAPTTSFFKFLHLVDDKDIPGTLNVGHALPVIAQAFIFIAIVDVETVTLISLLISSVAGAVLGAGIVSKLPEKAIQFGMGFALLAVAIALLAGLLNLYPTGGDAVGLQEWKLLSAIVSTFILGSLMTIGVGFYAPCMALVYALGMSPLAAFPIMMGACAFLMPAAGGKFIKEKAYNRNAAMALTVGGIPGVLIAAYLVTSIDLLYLKWIVLGVIFYTSFMMFKSGIGKKRSEPS